MSGTELQIEVDEFLELFDITLEKTPIYRKGREDIQPFIATLTIGGGKGMDLELHLPLKSAKEFDNKQEFNEALLESLKETLLLDLKEGITHALSKVDLN